MLSIVFYFQGKHNFSEITYSILHLIPSLIEQIARTGRNFEVEFSGLLNHLFTTVQFLGV